MIFNHIQIIIWEIGLPNSRSEYWFANHVIELPPKRSYLYIAVSFGGHGL